MACLTCETPFSPPVTHSHLQEDARGFLSPRLSLPTGWVLGYLPAAPQSRNLSWSSESQEQTTALVTLGSKYLLREPGVQSPTNAAPQLLSSHQASPPVQGFCLSTN